MNYSVTSVLLVLLVRVQKKKIVFFFKLDSLHERIFKNFAISTIDLCQQLQWTPPTASDRQPTTSKLSKSLSPIISNIE